MKLLIFEFATAMGMEDPALTAEGRAMLSGLIYDFESMDADYLLSQTLKSLIPKNEGICRPILIKGDVETWLTENIQGYDACLLIAPEEDLILHDLTKLIEEAGVEVLGSSSDAVMTCTNKYRMYESLKGSTKNDDSVLDALIKTEKVCFKDLESEDSKGTEIYRSLFDTAKNPEKIYGSSEGIGKKIFKVVKPADGVSCTGVHVVDSFKAFHDAVDAVKKFTNLPYFILQDYVEGVTASVSLLSDGENALPLSLNFQNVHLKNGKIDYNGGHVPLEHELSQRAMEIAKSTVESIPGLRGYVGVDVILAEDVKIVEVNSRLTTPYVALRQILNFNLGEAILESVHGKLPENVSIDGTIEFQKVGNDLTMKRV
ncbi:ATP-grasp domain-containing protein [Methanobacterium congolense]|uniref:Tyramine-L-glutamate ligase n=1 Tax=Methanobacterium congolense TaxID=118062 RepID=A0A1D3L0T5_9EURY|nr:ATP-grasp domain-containing protein [Methanobacterium congolense]SCG85274.1 Tyramine-L-glutamate ligase [Methanobacterium congolense]